MRRETRAAALMLLFLAVAAASGQPIADSSKGGGNVALQPLRRIYVPADQLDPEARGLLPIPRAEFDRRLANFTEAAVPSSAPPSATISEAVYRATLRGDQLVAGTAEWSIQRRTRATKDQLPEWLNLGPCSLALGIPTWQADKSQGSSALATDTAAIFGQDERQQLLLAVLRDGKLQVPWSLSGRRDDRGQLKFVFDLPPAIRQRMELRVPSFWRLSSDNAVVREDKATPAVNVAKPGLQPPETLWHVEITTCEHVHLSGQPRLNKEQAKPLVLVRETSSYVFTPGQMELDLSLELDISGSPLRQIRVRHDPRLQWTIMRWGEQQLTWSSEKSDAGEPIAVIQLPELLSGSSRLIQLSAVADWSPAPQKWPLPQVNVQDAIWQEGRVNVAAPRWLQLDAVAGPGSRLSATTLTSDSQGMDLMQFQLERNTATIEVLTAASNPGLEATSLLAMQVEPKQIVANFAAELTSSGAQQFSVECEIPRAWVIDSIETQPADALEDRVLRPRGNVQVATLFLKQPLRANRSLRVNARLRHVRVSGAEAWGDDMLQPVRFLNVAEAQRYVTLQLGDASFEPRLLNADGVEYVSAAELPTKVRALSEAPIGNWLVRLTDASRQPRFSLAPGSPRYTADSHLRLQLADEHIDLRLQIGCEPESSAVSNLLVQLRPPPTSEPQWRLEGDERNLVAERVETMIAASDMPGTALYRIELPRARDSSFSIVAHWSEAIAGPTQTPLVEIPEANSHAAHLEIIGPLAGSLTWQATRMRPLPIPSSAEDVRASYRYQSGQDARLTVIPLAEANRPVGGWISRCDVDTEFSPSGAGRHEARFVVTGSNVEVLEIRLAENARLARAAVDGRDVLAFSRTNDPRWLSIPLRSGDAGSQQQNPLVRLEYTSPPSKESAWLTARWTAPIPETRLPVLQSFWQVHLPSTWQPWPQLAMNAESRQPGSNPNLFATTFLALVQPEMPNAAVSRDLPAGPQVQITVYSPVWFGLIALVLAMLAAAGALRCRSWNPFRQLGVGLALLAVSMLITEPWSSLVQAVLAGWLTGCALQVFGRPILVAGQPVGPASTAFAIQHVARTLVVLLTLCCLATLSGDRFRMSATASAAEEAAPAKPWRVVIPVGEDRQPTDYVYISADLYAALFRSTARSNDQPEWLLRTAQYESRWISGTAETPAELTGIVARFEVESFHERSVVRLPFLHEQVRLNDQGVKIEGEIAAASWNSTADALQVEVNGIGRKRLELGLTLVNPIRDGAVGAAIRIPVVANSSVQLPALASAENVTVTSALGAELPSATADRQVALGPTDQLALQWSRAAIEPVPVIEAEQLLLWRLRPSSVDVKGKWQFRPLSGKLREVVLRADPRYRLLPTGNGSNIVRQWTEEGDVNLHHFVLERSTTGEESLTASFLLVGSTGIGSVVPPLFEPVADRVSRDWQAAWTAPGLQWNGKASTLPAAEFLQAWGDASLSPVQAFRSTVEAPRPTLAVTAVQNRIQAEEDIEWSLAPDQATVHYHLHGAQFSTTVNQLRFQLPPQFVVRRVAVSQNDTDVAIRWFRHADGLLTILLDEARTESWAVDIDAQRPHSTGKSVNLPVLQTAEIDIQAYECVIRRRAGATVSLGKLSGWKEVPDAPLDESLTADRTCAKLQWTSARPGSVPQPIPATVGAASTAYSGELLTRVLSLDDDWRLEVIANLESEGGTFDELQFSIPRDWEGPFEIDPPANYRSESLPGQSRNLLRVQLRQPVNAKLNLRITAPLVVEQELIRLPLVDLIGGQAELQRFVALPRSGENLPLQWQTTGLQLRPDLPAGLGNPAAGTENVYEAIIDRYRATARPERIRAEQPKIVLAEHQVAWQTDRRIVGQTDLMVLPNGAKSLLIQPPDAHELVAAIVNDVPGQLRREPGISGAATVELHSDTWPQWVAIIFRGRLAVTDSALDRWEFAAPRIAGVPVEQTRWQITGPAPLQLPADRVAAGMAATDDTVAPLEALVRMAQGASESPVGNHAESASTWLALWRKRWDREMTNVRKRPLSSPLAPVIEARLQTLETEMSDQLNTPVAESPGVVTLPAKGPFAIDVVQRVSIERPLFELRYGAAGDVANIMVTRVSAEPQRNGMLQVMLASALLIASVGITQINRSSGLRDWVIAYPQLVLAVLGAASLAIPGYLWLGLLLLACSLLATLHSPWQSRS